MCAVDDCEPWVVVRRTEPTARKAHACGECARVIARGERYSRTTGLTAWGQSQRPVRWETYRTCRHCRAVSAWMDVVCGGYPIGALLQELQEHWYDGYKSLPFARLIAQMRHRWHDGRDAVPTGVAELAQRMLQEAVAA